ncbi:hypothetical protein D3C71_2180420 [compost metagenome]
MDRDVGFIEKLRGDHQGRCALPGQFGRVFAALQIGLCVAQTPVDDDQHPFDFCRGGAYAHRDFT